MVKQYRVKGMSCVICAQTIEKKTILFPGVVHVNLQFANEKLTLEVDSSFQEEPFIAYIHKLGYEVNAANHLVTQSFKITKMSCVMCAQTIEKTLAKTSGINSIQVHVGSEEVNITYEADLIDLGAIKKIIEDLGYGVSFKKLHNKVKRKISMSLGISLIFSTILLYLAMGPMIKLPIISWLDSTLDPLRGALVQLGLVLVVMGIGRGFFIRGFKNLFKGHPNMDSLVALGTSASFLYSLYSTILMALGTHETMMPLYYEAVAVIITLVMVGKALEAYSKDKAITALEQLERLAPLRAFLEIDSTEKEVLVSTLKLDDVIIVHAGEQIPTDGVVLDGAGAVDEAMLTGESMPLDKQLGDHVVGASICLSGYLRIRVSSIGQDTILSKMIRLVKEVQTSKAPIARLADQVAGKFVPMVLVISILFGIIWMIIYKDWAFSLQIMVSVLVIACPCSLGLATPIAIIVGTGVGANHGILIKTAQILEEANRIKVVALDKTGTITTGHVQVVYIQAEDMTEQELLSMMASLEARSAHPLAKAIIQETKKQSIQLQEVSEFVVHQGLGLEGKIKGEEVLVGNLIFLKDKKRTTTLKEAIMREQSKGRGVVIGSKGNRVVGFVSIADTIKDSSVEGIRHLQAMGLEVVLISGDHEQATRVVADEVGISRVFYGVLPDEKGKILDTLRQEMGKIAMVGDGINDSVALSKSDVGIAMGNGTDIAMSSADIVLMKSDLRDVALAIHLSKKTIKNIKENLWWAFGYNLIGIPIAAGVLYPAFGLLLNPMIAALAMGFSSLSVVINALRLRHVHLKDEKYKIVFQKK